MDKSWMEEIHAAAESATITFVNFYTGTWVYINDQLLLQDRVGVDMWRTMPILSALGFPHVEELRFERWEDVPNVPKTGEQFIPPASLCEVKKHLKMIERRKRTQSIQMYESALKKLREEEEADTELSTEGTKTGRTKSK